MKAAAFDDEKCKLDAGQPEKWYLAKLAVFKSGRLAVKRTAWGQIKQGLATSAVQWQFELFVRPPNMCVVQKSDEA